jgi:protocatechuate 3,4-dioxygenase, alpha subunit
MTGDAPEPLIATSSQTVGPFFHIGPGAPALMHGTVAAPEEPGERIRLRVQVLDGDGAPVNDALVELRQPDAAGVWSDAPAGPC